MLASGPAVDGLAFDDPEPGLDKVQPCRCGAGGVDVDARVRREPVTDLAFVGGLVVHHEVQPGPSAVSGCE